MMMTDQLRQMILEDVRRGASVRRIAAAIGISQPALHAFVVAQSTGSGRMLDLLVDHYGCRLTKPTRQLTPAPGGPTR